MKIIIAKVFAISNESISIDCAVSMLKRNGIVRGERREHVINVANDSAELPLKISVKTGDAIAGGADVIRRRPIARVWSICFVIRKIVDGMINITIKKM